MALLVGSRIPKVHTAHYHGSSASLLRRVLLKGYRHFGKLALSRAARIICVSAAEQELMARDFPVIAARTHVIPNGVNLGQLLRATPFDLQGPTILYVGRIESYKNIDMLIRALRFLEGYSLFLVGDGPEWESLQKLAFRIGVNERLHRIVSLTDADLYRWYRSADVVVNLSRLESFGLTAVEAATAGAPLILSEIPVFCSLAKSLKGVRLVSLQVSDWELAQVIRDMSGRGRFKRDIGMFSWDTVTTRTLALYDKVLSASTENRLTTKEDKCRTNL